MPRNDPMNWDGLGKRWRRMVKGTKHEVYCHQLNIPPDQWTKDGSRAAMRVWWDTNQAARATLHPHAPELKKLGARLDYAKSHGLTGEADVIDAEIIRVQALPLADYSKDAVVEPDTRPAELDAATAAKIDMAAELLGIVFPPDMDPTTLRVLFSDADVVHHDRTRRDNQTPPERTVGALADKWLGDRQHEARAGVRSNENADGLRRAVFKFRDFAGASSPVVAVTVDLWHNWYVHCAGMVVKRDADPSAGWSAETAAKYFGVARSFVRWAWERDHLPALPKNLNAERYKFQRPGKDIPTFTPDDIRLLLGAARGVHRLMLLLMLNCGMTQKDVADLRKDQIGGGRIIRHRSKTARQGSARLVNYKLWPEVAALLTAHTNTNKDEPRALVTKSGKPWVWTETTADGKLRKSDNVATVFNNLKRRVGMNPKGKGVKRTEGKSLKVFRKTSATMLKGTEHADLRFWFLGHSERTVADRHYAASTQRQLDAAVTWLGEQYGLI